MAERGMHKVWTSHKPTARVTHFVGQRGDIFFNVDARQLRLSDGVTPGGLPLAVEATHTVTSLDQLTDVLVTDPSPGQVLMYDQSSEQFVNTSINLQGGDHNQVLVKKSSDPYDYQWEDMIVNIDSKVYTRLLDQVSPETLYIGEAEPESPEALPVWRIQRVTFDQLGSVLEVRWAHGGEFDQSWTNRLTLTYF